VPRTCKVTREGYTLEIVEASSLYSAVCEFSARVCVSHLGAQKMPPPTRDTIYTVDVDGQQFQVSHGRMMDWANAKAEADAQERLRRAQRGRNRT
jgi:hypothetical protein